MKTNVTDTSIKAFHQIKYEGVIGKQQLQILSAMARGRNYSLQELCRLTDLPVNAVSARVNELKAKNILSVCCKRKCSITGRTINAIETYREQRSLFNWFNKT